MIRSSVVVVAVGLLVLPALAQAHQGHTNRAPWDACADAVIDAACSWEDKAHARYIGTCRSVADALICVRNQPIQPASDAPKQGVLDQSSDRDRHAHSHPHRVTDGEPNYGAMAVGLLCVGLAASWARRNK